MAPAGEKLAATGGSDLTLPLAAGGAALLLAGVGATVVTRRRGTGNRTA
ncbi:LAETG motif-containing sortase-dependent surface protein [Yinghuangia aomiensis]